MLKTRLAQIMLTMLSNFIIWFLSRKEVDNMAMAYATLIIKGKKNFGDVPDKLQKQVRDILNDLDCGWMIDG